jgi:hypothetical protein
MQSSKQECVKISSCGSVVFTPIDAPSAGGIFKFRKDESCNVPRMPVCGEHDARDHLLTRGLEQQVIGMLQQMAYAMRQNIQWRSAIGLRPAFLRVMLCRVVELMEPAEA